jgi:hypothetical protein
VFNEWLGNHLEWKFCECFPWLSLQFGVDHWSWAVQQSICHCERRSALSLMILQVLILFAFDFHPVRFHLFLS